MKAAVLNMELSFHIKAVFGEPGSMATENWNPVPQTQGHDFVLPEWPRQWLNSLMIGAQPDTGLHLLLLSKVIRNYKIRHKKVVSKLISFLSLGS